MAEPIITAERIEDIIDDVLPGTFKADQRFRMGCAIRDAILNSMTVPEGWKLVPVEPTRDMDYAGHDAFIDAQRTETDPHRMVWEAMISTAPIKEKLS